MKQQLITLISGIFFGLGLGISQMIDRERVLGFLDVTGTWDPTLLFTLGGAVGVTILTFRWVLGRSTPIFSPKFYLPTKQAIDGQLLMGSAIFGIGWGIAGYCPGPGLVALVLGIWNPFLFVISLIFGSLVYQWITTQRVNCSQKVPTPKP
ncbi:YeeE/YedE family protein (plasmid) [Acaryochloris sp. 'Moss Beach']|uniref:DUF6691 family protein n=1 Tax=Acaryochloris TaxID=155977 RepID=UPI001BAF438A|nr:MULTISPECIES: DUF6691 family protein [Acaryochloris]QUY46032.1 YeeE/YedE family protein [Acaryochloris marina S15]UJB72633.1 YeeE/YedE family protein [Acaryochloris sp. 'Moss Beach']